MQYGRLDPLLALLRARPFRARTEFAEHGVIDVDGDARLALRGNECAALALGKIVFSSHSLSNKG